MSSKSEDYIVLPNKIAEQFKAIKTVQAIAPADPIVGKAFTAIYVQPKRLQEINPAQTQAMYFYPSGVFYCLYDLVACHASLFLERTFCF